MSRILYILLLAFFVSTTRANSLDSNRLLNDLATVSQLLSSGRKVEASEHLRTSKIYERIWSYTHSQAGVDFQNPSNQQLDRANEVADLITPYQSTLIELAQPDSKLQYKLNTRAYDILDFSHPTAEVHDAMLDIIANTKNDTAKSKAFNTIYDLRLEGDESQKLLDEWILDEQGTLREEMVDSLGILNRLAIPGYEEQFLEVLSNGFDEDGNILYSTPMYGLAASYLMLDGNAQSEMLPIIEKAMDQYRKAKNTDQALTNNTLRKFERLKSVLLGQSSPARAHAINGSGLIGLSRQIADERDALQQQSGKAKLEGNEAATKTVNELQLSDVKDTTSLSSEPRQTASQTSVALKGQQESSTPLSATGWEKYALIIASALLGLLLLLKLKSSKQE